MYKSYYNIAPPCLYKLNSMDERYVNSRLGNYHHQLVGQLLKIIKVTLFRMYHPNGTKLT